MLRVVWVVVFAVLAGCSQMHDSEDYRRHTMSRISKPHTGGDYLWFDVKITAALPLENEAAEQQRQLWLQDWLEQRGMCPNGYEIAERRPFDFLEDNPARMDIRYKVKCVVLMPEQAAG